MFMILTSPRNRLLRTWEHTSVCLTCPWPQSHDLDCTNSVLQGLPELFKKKKKNPSTQPQILAFNTFNSLIFKMDTNNIWRSMNKSMNDNCAAVYGTDSKGPHTDMDYGISVCVCTGEWSMLWGSQSQTCHNHGRRKERVPTACRWPPYLLAASGHTVISSYPITQSHYSLLSANYQGTPKLDNWDQFP